MSDKLILGADSSTSATKVIAFNDRGIPVAIGTNGYPLYTDKPGWCEQDAEDWWQAFCRGSQEVAATPGIDTAKMTGIGLTHQRFTFVPVDSDIRPLRRAILWNDIRCSKEAQYATQTLGKDEIFQKTGYPPGQWTLYKALWLKNHEPEIYEKTYKLVLVQDYLIYKLTGNLITLSGAATMTGALDIENPQQWHDQVIEALGVRRDLFIDPILPGGTVAGHVTKEAAAVTGLPEGLPVVTGAGDQPCGTLGAGVLQPGEIGINGGTSCTNELVASGVPQRNDVDYFIELMPSGKYVVENYIPSGGSALMNWYKNNFGAYEEAAAKKQGINVYELLYNQAGESPVGNRGMMVVPYFQGANGPYWDLDARGIITGLHTEFGRPHLVRGLMEGLAYESRREAELMEKGTATKVREIKMYGGSAKNDYWNQIFSDVFNKPLHVPETAETTSLGAAIAAAVGCGMYSDYKKAVDTMINIKKSYTPVQANADIYQRFYSDVYLTLYDCLQNAMGDIARINDDIDSATA